MKSVKVGTKDIRILGTDGVLVATLPSHSAVESVKNLVSRVKKLYPREDGKTYTTKSGVNSNTITIMVVDPEDVNRKNQ